MPLKKIKVIAFDADDTLWENETYFREAEDQFFDLMQSFDSRDNLAKELFSVEIANLELYGYGIKAFVLSMVETALKIGGPTLPTDIIAKIMDIGRWQLERPVILLDGVEDVLSNLHKSYRLVVVTKGDLLDQERKLDKSGLTKYFHHIEIVSEKKASDYTKLLKHLDIKAEKFVMIGNSLKSDVLPVLELGAYGIHVPFHTTWAHEQVDIIITDPKFYHAEKLKDILPLFGL
jgi:putative hydrolase of the HAD superfamily